MRCPFKRYLMVLAIAAMARIGNSHPGPFLDYPGSPDDSIGTNRTLLRLQNDAAEEDLLDDIVLGFGGVCQIVCPGDLDVEVALGG